MTGVRWRVRAVTDEGMTWTALGGDHRVAEPVEQYLETRRLTVPASTNMD